MSGHFVSTQTRKANKNHRCFACGLPIPKGVRYNRETHVQDGKIYALPMHMACAAGLQELHDAVVDPCTGECDAGALLMLVDDGGEDGRRAIEIMVYAMRQARNVLAINLKLFPSWALEWLDDFDKTRQQERMTCPNCSSKNVVVTLMSYHGVGHWSFDHNNAHCRDCGTHMPAVDFGAPDCAPMQGTEDWTEKQVRDFCKKLRSGEINVYAEEGVGIANLNALKRLELRRTPDASPE